MKKAIILLAVIAVVPTLAQASEGGGKVVDYWLHNNHDSFAFTLESQAGRPSCASYGTVGRYVVDITTQRGRMVMTAIMAAKTSGANVMAHGAGTCNFYGDSEDLLWARVY